MNRKVAGLARHGLTGMLAVLAAAYLISLGRAAIPGGSHGLLASLRASLFYVMLDWTMAAILLLGVYSILSLEEMKTLMRISLLSSVPAMWFVPAVLLIRAATPASILIGLLLMANSIRVLISRALSRRADLPARRRKGTVRIVSYRPVSPAFDRGTATVVFGALAFQLGMVAIWTGHGLPSAVLFGTGAMIWTLAAISRGACETWRRMDSPLRAGLTLILTIAISVAQMGSDTQAASDPTLPQMAQLTSHRPPKKQVTRVFGEARVIPPATTRFVEGVEGVILRPEIIRPRLTISVSRTTRHQPDASLSVFRFTGEYRLFPLASRDLKKDWSVQTGTPVDSVYATISGRPLQTEAYQTLDPPVDFTRLRKLELILVSHEGVPAAATVQLIGNLKVPDLGPEIFGLDQTPEETIEFALPGTPLGLRVTGIRVIFRCIGAQCSQSMRVAVQGFRLIGL